MIYATIQELSSQRATVKRINTVIIVNKNQYVNRMNSSLSDNSISKREKKREKCLSALKRDDVLGTTADNKICLNGSLPESL